MQAGIYGYPSAKNAKSTCSDLWPDSKLQRDRGAIPEKWFRKDVAPLVSVPFFMFVIQLSFADPQFLVRTLSNQDSIW